ncbi:LPS export ABC transporter periplasmic protein LptC [Candidatus Tokpelaia sp.]|uniref:LPS export ABC transporter periplasmic protein LptC n=1 Tax=Candidatus Tokpelaia sp. TaxID=2233777 RepID=UPI001238641E|nr:LPS export ABC transporter periplasmic protein LptC [Candidatus Tokpelaia sp.]KAA6406108.1 LPS export ABC transporter periplasmic protein LptC [Candidatus Tokpelaia sp.]
MNNPRQKPPEKSELHISSAGHKGLKPFSHAQKHSRRVRFLKIFLPIMAVIIAAIFSWFTFFADFPGKAVITLNSEEGQSNRLVMTAPKVEGYTKDKRPYAITAQKAIQDPTQSGIIELQMIAGTMPLGNRGNARIEAASAFFDNINGRLQFDRPFTVVTEDGIGAKLLSADVNVQSGQMTTSDPVEINSATQNLTAASMRITENGRIIHFGGKVHIVINQDKAQ